MREDNAEGRKLDVKTQEFLLGHILPGSQENYYDRSKVDWLRKEYAKLDFSASKSFSRGDVLAAIRREMLATRYPEAELDQLGDLSKLTTEQFVESLNRKALGPNGNGHHEQKVVPAGDVSNNNTGQRAVRLCWSQPTIPSTRNRRSNSPMTLL